MKKTSRNFSLDALRTLAIFFVIIIHTADAVFSRPDFFGGLSWWIAIILNSVSRVAIPLFILISGYLILNKEESFAKTLDRTIYRLLIPLIFWFVAMTVWNQGNISFTYLNFDIVKKLFTVNVQILYFLIILIGLYLVSPFLRKMLGDLSFNKQRNLTIGLVIFGIVGYFVEYIFSLCTPANSLTYWVPYTGLFVAGYFIGNNIKKIKTVSRIAVIYGATLILTIGFDYLYYLLKIQGNNLLSEHGCLSYYTNANLGINIVIMALALFTIFMASSFKWIKSDLLKRIILSISKTSFAIYVIHIFILNILDSKLHLFDKITPPFLYIFVKFGVIFLLSYAISLLLLKIPVIKKLFGER